MYRWPTGAPTACDQCGGVGWYCESQPPSYDDYRECYCNCAAGHVRRLAEGDKLVDWDDACLAVTGMTRKDCGEAIRAALAAGEEGK